MVDGDDNVFEIEAILEHRDRLDPQTKEYVREYYVSWLGYGSEDDTWEPEENLDNCTKVLKTYFAKLKQKTAAKMPSSKLKGKAAKRSPKQDVSSEDSGAPLAQVYQLRQKEAQARSGRSSTLTKKALREHDDEHELKSKQSVKVAKKKQHGQSARSEDGRTSKRSTLLSPLFKETVKHLSLTPPVSKFSADLLFEDDEDQIQDAKTLPAKKLRRKSFASSTSRRSEKSESESTYQGSSDRNSNNTDEEPRRKIEKKSAFDLNKVSFKKRPRAQVEDLSGSASLPPQPKRKNAEVDRSLFPAVPLASDRYQSIINKVKARWDTHNEPHELEGPLNDDLRDEEEVSAWDSHDYVPNSQSTFQVSHGTSQSMAAVVNEHTGWDEPVSHEVPSPKSHFQSTTHSETGWDPIEPPPAPQRRVLTLKDYKSPKAVEGAHMSARPNTAPVSTSTVEKTPHLQLHNDSGWADEPSTPQNNNSYNSSGWSPPRGERGTSHSVQSNSGWDKPSITKDNSTTLREQPPSKASSSGWDEPSSSGWDEPATKTSTLSLGEETSRMTSTSTGWETSTSRRDQSSRHEQSPLTGTVKSSTSFSGWGNERQGQPQRDITIHENHPTKASTVEYESSTGWENDSMDQVGKLEYRTNSTSSYKSNQFEVAPISASSGWDTEHQSSSNQNLNSNARSFSPPRGGAQMDVKFEKKTFLFGSTGWDDTPSKTHSPSFDQTNHDAKYRAKDELSRDDRYQTSRGRMSNSRSYSRSDDRQEHGRYNSQFLDKDYSRDSSRTDSHGYGSRGRSRAKTFKENRKYSEEEQPIRQEVNSSCEVYDSGWGDPITVNFPKTNNSSNGWKSVSPKRSQERNEIQVSGGAYSISRPSSSCTSSSTIRSTASNELSLHSSNLNSNSTLNESSSSTGWDSVPPSSYMEVSIKDPTSSLGWSNQEPDRELTKGSQQDTDNGFVDPDIEYHKRFLSSTDRRPEFFSEKRCSSSRDDDTKESSSHRRPRERPKTENYRSRRDSNARDRYFSPQIIRRDVSLPPEPLEPEYEDESPRPKRSYFSVVQHTSDAVPPASESTTSTVPPKLVVDQHELFDKSMELSAKSPDSTYGSYQIHELPKADPDDPILSLNQFEYLKLLGSDGLSVALIGSPENEEVEKLRDVLNEVEVSVDDVCNPDCVKFLFVHRTNILDIHSLPNLGRLKHEGCVFIPFGSKEPVMENAELFPYGGLVMLVKDAFDQPDHLVTFIDKFVLFVEKCNELIPGAWRMVMLPDVYEYATQLSPLMSRVLASLIADEHLKLLEKSDIVLSVSLADEKVLRPEKENKQANVHETMLLQSYLNMYRHRFFVCITSAGSACSSTESGIEYETCDSFCKKFIR